SNALLLFPQSFLDIGTGRTLVSCRVDGSDAIGVAMTSQCGLVAVGRTGDGSYVEARHCTRDLALWVNFLTIHKISRQVRIGVGSPGEIDGTIGCGRATGNRFEARRNRRGEGVAHC